MSTYTNITTINKTVFSSYNALFFEKSQMNFTSIVSGNAFLPKTQKQVDSKIKEIKNKNSHSQEI